MEQLNSIDQEFIIAFQQGKKQGIIEARSQKFAQIQAEAEIFAEELGKQLAKYEAFINILSQYKESQAIKPKMTAKVLCLIDELTIKMNKLSQLLDSCRQNEISQNKQYSVQLLKYDRDDLQKSFNIILGLTGMRNYAVQKFKSNKSEKQQLQQHDHEHEFDCQF